MESNKIWIIIALIWLAILTVLFPVSYRLGYDKAKVESAKAVEETLELANVLIDAKWRFYEAKTGKMDTIILEFIDTNTDPDSIWDENGNCINYITDKKKFFIKQVNMKDSLKGE